LGEFSIFLVDLILRCNYDLIALVPPLLELEKLTGDLISIYKLKEKILIFLQEKRFFWIFFVILKKIILIPPPPRKKKKLREKKLN